MGKGGYCSYKYPGSIEIVLTINQAPIKQSIRINEVTL